MAADELSPRSSFSATSLDFQVAQPLPTLATTEAQWLATVRMRARTLYLQAKNKRIPRAKSALERQLLDEYLEDDKAEEEEEEEEAKKCKDEAKNTTGNDSDGDDDEPPLLSQEETDASVAKVTGLLDTLALKINGGGGDAAPAEERLDWRQPDQLDRFLARCVEGWAMQNELLAHTAQMRRVLRRLHTRIGRLEDQKALALWYAAHLKDGGASDPASLLAEAETAVLAMAAKTLQDGVALQERETAA